MVINGLNNIFSLQTQVTYPRAEKIATRLIAQKDQDGDNQLSAAELGKSTEVFNKIDTNSDSFINREELLTALQKRIEERTDIRIEVSLNINILKANLGSLLSGILGADSNSDILSDILNESIVPGQDSQVSVNTRERFISAFAIDSLDNRGLPGSSGTLSAISGDSSVLSSLTGSQNDNRQLLLSLLVNGLGTPQEDANEIINILQNQPFTVVA